jgi:hypothetical protein
MKDYQQPYIISKSDLQIGFYRPAQLTGAHTGNGIADVVGNIIDTFGTSRSQLGYFVLDNAYANDTAVS